MRHKLLDLAEQSSLREKPLSFSIGDTVDVHTRILEGDKERIQIFSGIVIAQRGRGTTEMFTVRRIVAGEGVERSFPVNSPKVAEVVVKRHAKVRRAKLFYLRDRVGKATRLKERRAKVGEAEAHD
jgi:large subunit ribosomal protein L19